MNRDVSQRQRRVLRWSAWGVAVYTVLGFLILPLIVKAVAVSQLRKALSREVEIKSVRLNPYTLSATVRGLLIKDKDGETLLSWDEFHVNFQLVSLVSKSWVFKTVRLVKPYGRIQLNKDSSLNISDLINSTETATSSPSEPQKPLLVKVGLFELLEGRISYADLTPSTPFRHMIGPLNISLTHFETDPANENPYSFSGTTDSGERFSWSGRFYLNPLSSEGSLSFENIAIPKYAPLYGDLVQFAVRDGLVNLQGRYRFGISESNYVAAVSNASFSLRSFKLGAHDAAEDMVEIDSFSITNLNADAVARGGEIGGVTLAGAKLSLIRQSNATINLVEEAKPADESVTAPAGIVFLLHAATNTFAALLQSTNTWSATLHELTVTNTAFHWEDHANQQPVFLPLDDISVAARRISNVPGTNMTLDVSLRWNTNGSIRLESSTLIHPLSTDLTLNIEQLELSPLGPYLESFVNLFLLSSKLGLDGRVQMNLGADGLPVVNFSGNTRLDDVATKDGLMNEDLVKWRSLTISGVDATLHPPSVAVKEIALVEPFVLLAIQTNHALNTVNILKAENTDAPSAEAETAAVETEAPTESDVGIGRKLGRLLRETLTANTNADGSPLSPGLSVGAFVLSNATIRYADYSLLPQVKASIQEMSGSVTAISSTGLQPSDVHFSGRVGASGTFDITGHIFPLTPKSASDLKASINDVDLGPLSPYAGKYVGYRLNRGSLGLDVEYLVSERLFTAKNILRVDQLTFGQKVNSPDATALPVRLAVAVLKDSEGKIELDIPIDGNLDDPQLRFGKVISRAIVNIIVKIATSPFAMLGAVFGGNGEDVSFQDFTPGSSELTEDNIQKLDRLLNGLGERPALNLAIEGSYDPVLDLEALRIQKLNNRFKQEKWDSLRKSVQNSIAPDDVIFSTDERNDLLRRAYESLLEKGAAEQALTNASVSSGASARSVSTSKGAESMMQKINPPAPAPVIDMEKAVLQTVEVTEADLLQLAADRARRVLQRLQDSGRIDTERLSIAVPEEISPGAPAARVYFHLQ